MHKPTHWLTFDPENKIETREKEIFAKERREFFFGICPTRWLKIESWSYVSAKNVYFFLYALSMIWKRVLVQFVKLSKILSVKMPEITYLGKLVSKTETKILLYIWKITNQSSILEVAKNEQKHKVKMQKEC
jgi:hypothetical protein